MIAQEGCDRKESCKRKESYKRKVATIPELPAFFRIRKPGISTDRMLCRKMCNQRPTSAVEGNARQKMILAQNTWWESHAQRELSVCFN